MTCPVFLSQFRWEFLDDRESVSRDRRRENPKDSCCPSVPLVFFADPFTTSISRLCSVSRSTARNPRVRCFLSVHWAARRFRADEKEAWGTLLIGPGNGPSLCRARKSIHSQVSRPGLLVEKSWAEAIGRVLCPAQKAPPATMLRRWRCPYRTCLYWLKRPEPDTAGPDIAPDTSFN